MEGQAGDLTHFLAPNTLVPSPHPTCPSGVSDLVTFVPVVFFKCLCGKDGRLPAATAGCTES